MDTKKAFVNKGLTSMVINEYLSRRLSRAGFIEAKIFKTPIGTRIVISAGRPAIVIGRRGATVKEMSQTLESKFGVNNPQIDVVEVPEPELNAKAMAHRMARALVRGVRFRRAAFFTLRHIMEAGAMGAEVTVSGKLTSRRARYEKFRDGVILKSGMVGERYVDEATAHILLKPGIIGVKVKIMPPVKTPDQIEIQPVEAVE